MMPGGRMNPRQMNRMMKKMGLNMEEVQDVKEVIIRSGSGEIIIKAPSVTIMDVQGQKSYQIQGGKEEKKSMVETIPQEDIDLVVSQTGVSEDEAKMALKKAKGEPAEAIISLMG